MRASDFAEPFPLVTVDTDAIEAARLLAERRLPGLIVLVALVIITTALAISDGRLYEAAQALRAGSWRIFWTVTLPGARYGVISAVLVVFVLVITDFGVPKVVGGQYNVLATDIYKQVIGQQNFQMGAVVGLILLLPAVAAFVIDRIIQRRQTAMLSARAVPIP